MKQKLSNNRVVRSKIGFISPGIVTWPLSRKVGMEVPAGQHTHTIHGGWYIYLHDWLIWMVNVRKYTTWMVWDIVGSRLSIHHQLNVYTYIISLYIICSPFYIHLCYGYTVIKLLFPEQWSSYYQPNNASNFPYMCIVWCLPNWLPPRKLTYPPGEVGKIIDSNMPNIGKRKIIFKYALSGGY